MVNRRDRYGSEQKGRLNYRRFIAPVTLRAKDPLPIIAPCTKMINGIRELNDAAVAQQIGRTRSAYKESGEKLIKEMLKV